MKIAVFSDSHGNTQAMICAVREYCPGLIIHLGDYTRDADKLSKEFPDIPMRSVRGNCDIGSLSAEADRFEVEGVEVFITHGHRYSVKLGLDRLLNAAHFSGAALALFGHTHKAAYFETGAMQALNPGAAGDPRNPTYARIEIQSGRAPECRIVPLTDVSL